MKKALAALASMLLVLALAGCAAKAANGKYVTVSYTGKLPDGSVFDTSEGAQPLEFVLGGQQMLPAFEQAIIGMKVGEKKTFTIKAADAYGDRDESLLIEVPKASFPADMAIEKGMQLGTTGPSGETMVVTVNEIRDSSVMIDYNHPLAGKDLTFDVTIVAIREPTEDELKAVGAGSRRTDEPKSKGAAADLLFPGAHNAYASVTWNASQLLQAAIVVIANIEQQTGTVTLTTRVSAAQNADVTAFVQAGNGSAGYGIGYGVSGASSTAQAGLGLEVKF